MNQSELIQHAAEELYKVKQHATQEELDNLLKHLSELDPHWPTQCLYGLMTGSCYSKRAEELIQLCCPVFFTGLNTRNPTDKLIPEPGSFKDRNWSAVEVALINAKPEMRSLIQELAEAEFPTA